MVNAMSENYGVMDELEALAMHIPGSDYINTGGGNMCVSIPKDDGETTAYALVSEDYSEDGTFALGVYSDEEDEGYILKEWLHSKDAQIDAQIVKMALATYWQE